MISLSGFSQPDINNDILNNYLVLDESISIDSILAISEAKIQGQLDESLFYAKIAYQRAEMANCPKDIAKSLLQMGQCYDAMVNYKMALDYYERASAIFDEIDFKQGRFEAYLSIGLLFQHKSDLEKARENYELALDFGIENEDAFFIAESNNSLGLLSKYIGDNFTALKYFLKATEYYQYCDRPIKKAQVDNSIGLIYLAQKDVTNALIYFEKAISQFEIHDETKLLIGTYLNLSEVYSKMKKYELAMTRLEFAFKISDSIGDQSTKLKTLLKINDTYIQLQKYDKALTNAQLSLHIAEAQDNKSMLSQVYIQLATTYKFMGAYTTSLNYFEKAENIIKDFENYESKFALYRDMALTYNQIQFYSKAMHYANLLSELSNKINVTERTYDAIETRYLINKKKGNYPKALKDHELLTIYRDSILIRNKALELGKLGAQHQADYEKQQLELQQKDKDRITAIKIEKEENIRNVFIFGFIFVLSVAVLMYRSARRKTIANRLLKSKNNEIVNQQKELSLQKDCLSQLNQEIKSQKEQISVQNKILQEKNNELKKINKEKDSVLSIVAHDLRAPFNRNKGIAELIKSHGKLNRNQSKYLEMMIDLCNEGLAIAEDLLCLNSANNTQDELSRRKIYLNMFVENILQGYRKKIEQKGLNLIINPLENDIQLITDPNYLGRILDNLLSNAIKFTYPGKNIFVSLDDMDTSIIISIKDEGQGISKEEQIRMFKKFQKLSSIPTGGEISTGLGLSIVQSLTKKLGGKIQVNSAVGLGTEILLAFDKNVPQLKYNPADKKIIKLKSKSRHPNQTTYS